MLEKTLRQGCKGLAKGKGGPIESRPIVKSEFRQIPPNRSQHLARIALTWSLCLSTIGQFTVIEQHVRSRRRASPSKLKTSFDDSMMKVGLCTGLPY